MTAFNLEDEYQFHRFQRHMKVIKVQKPELKHIATSTLSYLLCVCLPAVPSLICHLLLFYLSCIVLMH